MCSAPKAPKVEVPVARQAPRMPDGPSIATQAQDQALRRSSIASMILTNPNGMGSAPTAGKTVLGA
jgi:hypothetical protein